MLRFLLLIASLPLLAQITEIRRWRVVGVGSTDARPSTCASNRDAYINTSTNAMNYCVNGAWVALGGGGSGTVTNIATTSPITGGPITSTGTIACPTCVTSAASLTSNLPVFGAGSQAAQVGTRSGNTTKVVTMDSSTPATNDCAKWDANGNLTTAGAACGTSTGLGDPGSNGVVHRNGAGTSTVASATEIGAPLYCADAGSNDTYACSLSPAPAAYANGAVYQFKANTANTGAATINFNSLGAKTIKKVAGGITTDLSNNDIRSGQVVTLTYDGTNMQMQSLLGNAGGSSFDVGQFFFNRTLTIPVVADYAWINQGGAAAADKTGCLELTAPNNAGHSLRILKKTAPATPYSFTFAMSLHYERAGTLEAGMGWRQSSDGKVATYGFNGVDLAGAGPGWVGRKFTNATTYSADYSYVTGHHLLKYNVGWYYGRIADNGTNRIVSYSLDGTTWREVQSIGRTDFLTGDEVILFVNNNGTGYDARVCFYDVTQGS